MQLFDTFTLNPSLIFLISLIWGGVLGSFSNMLIYRLPHDMNIALPRSTCPKCNKHLTFKDLIPLFSYLFLKGKCSHCQKIISYRYFLVEALYVLITFWYLYPYSNIFMNHQFYIFTCICIILFFTDLYYFILPVSLNCLLILFGLFFSHQLGLFPDYFFHCLIFTAILLLFRAVFNFFYKKDTFGLGDIILIAGICLNWGWILCLLSFYIATLIGGIYSIFLLISKRKSRVDYIAFGPFLIIGFFIAFFLKDYILFFVI